MQCVRGAAVQQRYIVFCDIVCLPSEQTTLACLHHPAYRVQLCACCTTMLCCLMLQALQDYYGGVLHRRFFDDFRYFASVTFKHFGDRVKLWSTLNEPNVVCDQGYHNGQFAPGIKGGKRSLLACGHNLLLAHAAAVEVYRTRYQPQQQGRIGITLNMMWAEPFSDRPEGRCAVHVCSCRNDIFLLSITLHKYTECNCMPMYFLVPICQQQQLKWETFFTQCLLCCHIQS